MHVGEAVSRGRVIGKPWYQRGLEPFGFAQQ
jgi:hypothetical protein